MFCKKCGNQIPEGALFCGECGAKAEERGSGQIEQRQSVPISKPLKKNISKKTKMMLFIGGGAVLLLAAAAILIFVVFAGGTGNLLSGNTLQTKFINDNVKVIERAFSDFDSDTINRMKTSPFDIEIEMDVEKDGEKEAGEFAFAYDKLALGISMSIDGDESVLLLADDSLYIDSNGYVQEIEFDADRDLDVPMSLDDRIMALTDGMTDNKVDYQKLIEMLINSIDEECFDVEDSSTTLTLNSDDILKTLETFAENMEEDEELSEAIEDMIKEATGMSMSLSDAMNFIVPMLESRKDFADFKIVWEVSYENSVPVAIELSYDEEGDDNDFTVSFGYEKDGKATHVEFGYIAKQGRGNFDGSYNIEKARDEIEYSGVIQMAGNEARVSIEGIEEWSGQKVNGSIEIVLQSYGETQATSIEYEETILFNVPKKSVEDDKRFRIDTKDAKDFDINSLMSGSFDMGFGIVESDAQEEAVAVEEPVAEEVVEAVAEEEPEPEPMAEMIGVFVPYSDGYYKIFLEALENRAEMYGVELEIYITEYDIAKELAGVQMMAESQEVAAMIIYPVKALESIESIEVIAEASGIPVVFMDDSADGSYTAVSRNHRMAGRLAADNCASGKVFVVNGMEGLNFANDLLEGFNSADLDVVDSVYTEFDTEQAAILTEAALEDNPDIETVVCFDPVGTEGVIQALEAFGFQGNLVCFLEENAMENLPGIQSFDISLIYFSVEDVADKAVQAMAGFLMGANSPELYVVDPSVK